MSNFHSPRPFKKLSREGYNPIFGKLRGISSTIEFQALKNT